MHILRNFFILKALNYKLLITTANDILSKLIVDEVILMKLFKLTLFVLILIIVMGAATGLVTRLWGEIAGLITVIPFLVIATFLGLKIKNHNSSKLSFLKNKVKKKPQEKIRSVFFIACVVLGPTLIFLERKEYLDTSSIQFILYFLVATAILCVIYIVISLVLNKEKFKNFQKIYEELKRDHENK